MKALKLYLVFGFVLSLSLSVFAQQRELTKEEWQALMDKNTAKKESLTKEIGTLQNDVNTLAQQSAKIQTYDDCIDEKYTLVNAKRPQVDDFRRAVTELEGKIRRKEGPKAARQADLDALKKNSISALPEFYDRVHKQMQRMLDEWVEAVVKEEPKDAMYTVVKGDCLWFIARRKEYYGNGFAWPKIYNANRDQIKNPDLIYPKQVFRIPPLTEDEKAKYEKMRRNYKPAPTN